MTVRFKQASRLGAFQCEGCNLRFELQPGGHDSSRCPRCRSLYYKWLDYEGFAVGSPSTVSAS
jgi:predicted Zn-ribbon and HTH transcriptional regulator